MHTVKTDEYLNVATLSVLYQFGGKGKRRQVTTYPGRRSGFGNIAHPGRRSRWHGGGADRGRYHAASASLPVEIPAPTPRTTWVADVAVAAGCSAVTARESGSPRAPLLRRSRFWRMGNCKCKMNDSSWLWRPLWSMFPITGIIFPLFRDSVLQFAFQIAGSPRMIYFFYQDYHIKDEIGEACNMHCRHAKFIKFWSEKS